MYKSDGTCLCREGSIAKLAEEGVLAACVGWHCNLPTVGREGTKGDAELLLLIKTTGARLAGLGCEAHADHPHEVPEFLMLRIVSDGASSLA